MCAPLTVDGNLRAVAVPLHLHLVPLAVVDDLLIQPDEALAAAKVEAILEPALDNLQDAVVDEALGVHERGHAVEGAEAQAEAEVAFDGALEGVLGVAAPGELDGVDDGALAVLTGGDVHGADGTRQAGRALAGVTLLKNTTKIYTLIVGPVLNLQKRTTTRTVLCFTQCCRSSSCAIRTFGSRIRI